MGKQTKQGTTYESHLRNRALLQSRTARRLAKAGQAHEADVEIEGGSMRPAVAWQHWIVTEGHARRKSFRTVTILEEDWWKLLSMDTEHELGWHIQSKSTQRLNVSAILRGLIAWQGRQAP
jgi:hypothetical protein